MRCGACHGTCNTACFLIPSRHSFGKRKCLFSLMHRAPSPRPTFCSIPRLLELPQVLAPTSPHVETTLLASSAHRLSRSKQKKEQAFLRRRGEGYRGWLRVASAQELEFQRLSPREVRRCRFGTRVSGKGGGGGRAHENQRGRAVFAFCRDACCAVVQEGFEQARVFGCATNIEGCYSTFVLGVCRTRVHHDTAV